MKILLVDDNLNWQRVIKEQLEEEGYNIVVAGTGKDALQMFSKDNPDIVILDFDMPDIDGISLLRKMKEKHPSIPTIMASAYVLRDDFAVWAVDAYIVKSSDFSELKKTLKKIINKL